MSELNFHTQSLFLASTIQSEEVKLI